MDHSIRNRITHRHDTGNTVESRLENRPTCGVQVRWKTEDIQLWVQRPHIRDKPEQLNMLAQPVALDQRLQLGPDITPEAKFRQ